MPLPSRYSPSCAGCWFDSARGQYMGQAVQEEAIDRGWLRVNAILDTDHEQYCDAWVEAEEYLQTLAPKGYSISSNENGDFGMWAVCDNCGEFTEEPQEDCEVCEQDSR